MSLIVDNYIPEKGIMVFSDSGYQRATSVYGSGINYQSRIGTDILPNNKFSVDSCWETENIYYINNNTVYKINYSGEEITSATFSNAFSLAVSQSYFPMSDNPDTIREDNGCWIVNNDLGQLIKTDNQLNTTLTLENIPDPKLVTSSDFDSGCYLFDDELRWIMKIGSNMQVESYISYNSIRSGMSSSDVKRSVTDQEGSLWILIDRYIYKIANDNGRMYKDLTLDPIVSLELESETTVVSDFDIDKMNPAIYVVGGCRNRVWILQYNMIGVVENGRVNLQMEYPVAIKVTQCKGSDGIYVITESNTQYLPYQCESSSSSTSSSSSEGYSTSSSSSSSSTSDGLPCCDRWEVTFPDPSYNSYFTEWNLADIKTRNAPSCRIWAEFTTSGTSPITQEINIYKSGYKSAGNLIASGSLDDNITGDIPISQENGSGISGTVGWYESPPGTHPYTINWPNSLFELTCIESSSSSSSISSSSSSSYGYSSSSSSSGMVYDCDGLVCGTPIGGSSNACGVFSEWNINGTTNLTTKNGNMVVQMRKVTATVYTLDLYNADEIGPTPLGDLIASGNVFASDFGSYEVTFTEVGSSGVYGSVLWSGYTGTDIDESYTLLTCPEEMSSSSSSTSAEACDTDTITVIIESGFNPNFSFVLGGVTNRNSTGCVLYGERKQIDAYRQSIDLYKESSRSTLVATTGAYVWSPIANPSFQSFYGIYGNARSLFGGGEQTFRIILT